MPKKECVAMLLAGGQGSRLGSLTKSIAKPAVSFGGKYRIIDFSLSNCANSNIDTVGVLTQYKPFVLNSYIGLGAAWDLDGGQGGLQILPPYVGDQGGQWYKGTANAIYQNIDFIDHYQAEYVLIISGDHIYRMDYSRMLEFHKSRKADVTISVISVPREEASRFGIITVGQENSIVKFTEKPAQPDSSLASMGIYIFSWPLLKNALREDERDADSEHDFGKNVIPKLLYQGKKMLAYEFKGYWKDVGTTESYYEANMDLLSESAEFDLFDVKTRIFSNSDDILPHYIGPKAHVENSIVSNGSTILGAVVNSIIAPGVFIGTNSVVQDSIILPNVKIANDSRVSRAIIGEQATIGAFCRIGADADRDRNRGGITVIEGNSTVEVNSVINEGVDIFRN